MDAARDKIARWVGEAAGQGAEFMVFPEYGAMELSAVRGLQVAADVPASLEAVSEMLGEIDALHAELARRHQRLHPCGKRSVAPRRRTICECRARLVSPTGRIGTQEKHIMTPFERAWGIAGGRHQRVFDTGLGRIGIAVCYDSEFPLLVRAQAEAGADLILIPSCTERVSGAHRVRTAALARALENGCATVVSPTVGEAPWCLTVDHNEGIGGIYVPAEAGVSDTGILAEGRLSEPGWVFADIDLGALKNLRASGEMRNASDWRLQPGAAPLAHNVEVVDLAERDTRDDRALAQSPGDLHAHLERLAAPLDRHGFRRHRTRRQRTGGERETPPRRMLSTSPTVAPAASANSFARRKALATACRRASSFSVSAFDTSKLMPAGLVGAERHNEIQKLAQLGNVARRDAHLVDDAIAGDAGGSGRPSADRSADRC